ncbi:superoxide dismutase family protein [Aestuariibius insulae]|uniref:superoxide dismutase family protein n=1 Tax=Aestuariibius insulae TaxID=2058287 RepID=UPI00345EF377
MKTTLTVAALVLLPGIAAAEAHSTPAAVAEVQSRDGAAIGTVYVNPTASGFVTINIALTDLPEGALGVHIHETGDCSAEDFSSAGGHLAEGREHGILTEGGPHPGDLPNVIVQQTGVVNVEYFSNLLEIDEMMFDEDGSAFIVHSGPDDYTSQPSGAAGDRIACGVFTRGES